MLRELRIKNFAIIDELRLVFRPGLNVITGETGAGKSIIIQALGLLCGSRAAPEVVRTSADSAAIEALFEIDNAAALLGAVGLDEDDEVLVRRAIPRTGKGRVHINGSPVTVSQLALLGGRLLHLYGQHDQTLLLRQGSHLDLLDSFANLEEAREHMASAHAQLASAQHRLRELEQARETAAERRELLEFHLQELRAADVRPNEEEDLRREREVLRHAERLMKACRDAEGALYSEEAAVVERLGRLGATLHELAEIDDTLGEPAELIDGARIQLEEAAGQLRSYGNRLRFDPGRLEQVEERHALLSRLSRKHRVSIAELAEFRVKLEEESAALEGNDAECARVAQVVESRSVEALHIARKLSHQRAEATGRLDQEMASELAALGMNGAVFAAVRTPPDNNDLEATLTPTGFDTVEFHLSTNAGEPPKPLARIASGGELSRVMLALKALTASAAEAPILIFDEVDSGIGGAVADAVARRLKLLGRTHQLLCITHLPQIAAHADHHYAVDKVVEGGRTITTAKMLDERERVGELSRMLGGAVAPSEAERYARRLIKEARTV